MTHDASPAVLNAALYLRDQAHQTGFKSLAASFAEAPVTVAYTTGQGALFSLPGGSVRLSDDELDAERWGLAESVPTTVEQAS